ncbi:MAG TPA: hypothetical protein PKA64_21975 [Myxococcota bacterium]|nr:hypothetical protein [Myxococcota bacterium]
MTPSWPAAAVFALFVASSLAIGNHYPFYTFDMYAQLQYYTESAVLVFHADGAEVELEQFKDFSGPELFTLRNPQGIPYSMGWRTFESRRYMELHQAPEGAAPGPVSFEAGYVVVRIGPDGPEQVRPFEALARGRAWPR